MGALIWGFWHGVGIGRTGLLFQSMSYGIVKKCFGFVSSAILEIRRDRAETSVKDECLWIIAFNLEKMSLLG